MWYFSWILGTGLALAFGILNAIWYEIMDQPSAEQPGEERSQANLT
jgi:cytochrome bd-I ubiquinol oxidase subunit X